MINPLTTKTYTAGGTIAPNRMVKFDSSDNVVIQAAALSDLVIGVSTGNVGNIASGDRVDVIHIGIAEVKAGGSITRGSMVTSDASGQAVALSGAAASNCYALGYALVSAASGDVFPVLIVPSRPQQ